MMSCDFHESYFGAQYPDACCIDGFLWDLDSCDVPGGDLTSGGEVPCPQCNHGAWLDRFEDELFSDGYGSAETGQRREYKHRKVRNEQPQDEAKMQTWWLCGYDCAIEEMLGGLNP